MADIPTYDPQASPRPLPTPYDDSRVPPDAFGAATGQGLQQLGADVEDIGRVAKQRADTSAVIGAIGQAKGALNSIILDPEKGYASLKGADAVAGREKALQSFDRQITGIESTLTNPEQQRAFQLHALTIREEGFRHAVWHEHAQIEDVQQAQFKGAADETSRTLQNPLVISNPAEVDKNLTDLKRIATAEAVRRFGAASDPVARQAIVGPTMQKAALDAMEGAISSQDPKIAQTTLAQVSQYLGTHERFYTKAVAGLVAQAGVSSEVRKVLTGAATPVVMPGGAQVARIDGVKSNTALAALPPDTPHLDLIIKGVEVEQERQKKLWDANVAQVSQRVQTAGQDPITGLFDISSSRISPSDKAWLNANAPGELTKLATLDARESRIDRTEAKLTSAQNYSTAAAWLHDEENKVEVLGMTRAQWQSRLLDDKQFPGGLTPPDRTKALAEYDKVVKAGTKLDEPVPKTVTDAIKNAVNGNPILEKQLRGAVYGQLLDAANREYAANKTIGTEKLREFVQKELAKVDVNNTGWIARDTVRRIEYETNPAYAGKTAVTKEGETIQRPVRIKTPKGAFKWIKGEQLQEALTQGATLAP